MGPVFAGKYAPSRMPKSSESSIVFTIGSVVRKPLKGFAFLAAGAGATERFTKGLAVELAPIRVNVVSPGLVKTEVGQIINRRLCLVDSTHSNSDLFPNAKGTYRRHGIQGGERIAGATCRRCRRGWITSIQIEFAYRVLVTGGRGLSVSYGKIYFHI
jgi:NAD(P)-dependent dehydrogenase (short-subunit alcohol dehydrogenase family)